MFKLLGAIGERIEKRFFPNLINHGTYVNGYLTSTTGTVTASSLSETTDYIEVIEGKSYILKNYNTDGATRTYCCFDGNKNIISGGYITSGYSKIFTMPSNAKYFRVSVQIGYGSKAIFRRLQ